MFALGDECDGNIVGLHSFLDANCVALVELCPGVIGHFPLQTGKQLSIINGVLMREIKFLLRPSPISSLGVFTAEVAHLRPYNDEVSLVAPYLY